MVVKMVVVVMVMVVVVELPVMYTRLPTASLSPFSRPGILAQFKEITFRY